jgi:hypothetical protein
MLISLKLWFSLRVVDFRMPEEWDAAVKVLFKFCINFTVPNHVPKCIPTSRLMQLCLNAQYLMLLTSSSSPLLHSYLALYIPSQ